MTISLAGMQAWAARPGVQRAGVALRWLFFAAVIGWLLLKVQAIGWGAVWRALPTAPSFYILFVAMFLALPASETWIFRLLLGRPLPGAFPAFIRKRVFNSAFVGYSGEVYLFVWARQRLGIESRPLLVALKDNAVLSALASAAVPCALLAAFVATGQARWIADWLDSAGGLLLATLLGGLFLLPLAIRLRRRILNAGARVAAGVFGIHLLRIGGVVVLQATQWALVLPAEPWSVWLTFLTMQMVISRLPLIPNRDLLFLSAGLELSHAVHGPREAMAGLLLAGGALGQGSNLLFFLLTSIERRRRGVPAVPRDDGLEAAVATPAVPPVTE